MSFSRFLTFDIILKVLFLYGFLARHAISLFSSCQIVWGHSWWVSGGMLCIAFIHICTLIPFFVISFIRSLSWIAFSRSVHLLFPISGVSLGVYLTETSQWSEGTSTGLDFHSNRALARGLTVYILSRHINLYWPSFFCMCVNALEFEKSCLH